MYQGAFTGRFDDVLCLLLIFRPKHLLTPTMNIEGYRGRTREVFNQAEAVYDLYCDVHEKKRSTVRERRIAKANRREGSL